MIKDNQLQVIHDSTTYRREFYKLYEKYTKKLYITALFILKNSADAEDAVQDTALLAMQQFSKLRNIDCFKSWIMRILINKCNKMKFLRFRFSTEHFPLDIAVEDPNYDSLSIIKDILLKLPHKYALVITLRYLNDLSIKEISDILKTPEGTIKSQLHRGIEKLKYKIDLEGGL
jgi:RNA polymerase sigma-70 factor (ECF subfamily)